VLHQERGEVTASRPRKDGKKKETITHLTRKIFERKKKRKLISRQKQGGLNSTEACREILQEKKMPAARGKRGMLPKGERTGGASDAGRREVGSRHGKKNKTEYYKGRERKNPLMDTKKK